jgi:hypothetical protein
MLVKKMTYTDYNGNTRTEDFHFNLSKGELMEMNLAAPGADMASILTRIINEQNNEKIVETFKSLIAKAYGKKSDDGRKFVKSAELLDDFIQTEAYSDLFWELATSAESAAAFVNGILPKKGEQTIIAGV